MRSKILKGLCKCNSYSGNETKRNSVSWNSTLKNLYLYILLLTLTSFSFCYDENRIDSWEMQKRFGLIVEAKATQCGNRPSYPLFFSKDRPPGEVKNCEIDLLNSKCPFNAYPWSCVRIF